MSELDIVLASYRDMFGVKSDRANEIHRLACDEVARLRAAEQMRAADSAKAARLARQKTAKAKKAALAKSR